MVQQSTSYINRHTLRQFMTTAIGMSLICIFYVLFCFRNRSTASKMCVCVCARAWFGLFIRSICCTYNMHALCVLLLWYYDRCVASNICLYISCYFCVTFAHKVILKYFCGHRARDQFLYINRNYSTFNGKKKKTKQNEMRWNEWQKKIWKAMKWWHKWKLMFKLRSHTSYIIIFNWCYGVVSLMYARSITNVMCLI